MKKVNFLVLTLASLSLTCSKGIINKIDKTLIKEANDTRIACHTEWDYIGKQSVDVCGAFTEYPNTEINGLNQNDTNNLSSEVAKLISNNYNRYYNEWFSKITYSIEAERINFNIDGKDYVSDVYLPSEFNTDNVWGVVSGETEVTQATSIKFTFKQSTQYSVSASKTVANEVSFGAKLGKYLDINYSHAESYTSSESFTNGREKGEERDYANTHHDPYANMQLLHYVGFLPVEVRSYESYGRASYIKYKTYVLIKVSDTLMYNYPNAAFISPFNKNGQNAFIDEPLDQTNQLKLIGTVSGKYPVYKI